MSKGYKDIGNERYYGCATRSEAAELGGKGQGDNSLCTAKNVIDGTYGVTFVEHTKLSYEELQAVAYVDLQKDTATVEQEVNLELASVTCGTGIAQETRQKEEVLKTTSESFSWDHGFGRLNSNTSFTTTKTFSFDTQNQSYTIKSLSGTGSCAEHPNISSYITSRIYEYAVYDSNGGLSGYQQLTVGTKLNGKYSLRFKITVTNTSSSDWVDGTGAGYFNAGWTVTIGVSYTAIETVSKGNNYFPCFYVKQPTNANCTLLSPKSSSVYKDSLFKASDLTLNTNIINLILDGPVNAGYDYSTGTNSDSRQLGIIVPLGIKFKNYSNVELASFQILSALGGDGTNKVNYSGYNVQCAFGSYVMSTGCMNGGFEEPPFKWVVYNKPDYSDGKQRDYKITELFANTSDVNFVLELKWNTRSIPSGSVQNKTLLCSTLCEVDVSNSNESNKKRTSVQFNIWLNPFNRQEVPPPPQIDKDYLYVRMKSNDNTVLPFQGDANKNKYLNTFNRAPDTSIWEPLYSGEDRSYWYRTDWQNVATDLFGGIHGQLGGEKVSLDTLFGKYEFYGDYGVDSIFTNNDDLLEVILPSWVNIIGPRCFAYCKNLEKVTFTSNIRLINYDAFVGCSSLQTADLSLVKGALTIESHAFKGNANMQELIFSPDAVLYVYGSAFEDNTSMKMTIAGGQGFNEKCGFELINDYAFNYCYNLGETLHLGYCNHIGLYAFENCSTIKNIYVEWKNDGLTELYGRSTVKTGAFKGCTNVQTIYSKGLPARMHCCNIWYRKAINPRTAKLYVEDKGFGLETYADIYARQAQWGDFETYGNLHEDADL